MISAAEFREKWDGDIDSFVHFPAHVLAAFGVPPRECEFQEATGIPSWAAPNMHFFFDDGDGLPPPEDEAGEPLQGDLPKLGQIGSTGEGFPICLMEGGTGEILWIEPGATVPVRLLNSSFTQLLATLLSINEMVCKAIACGEENGLEDAWRTGNYPDRLNEELENQIRAIDPEAMNADAYWSSALHRR